MLATLPLWAQANSSGAQPAVEMPIWSLVDSPVEQSAEDETRMITPAPINDEGYSLAFAPERPRSNYFRGGLNFGTIYDSNLLYLSTNALPVSDFKYSVWPSFSLEQSRSRLRWDFTYSPEFAFHQTYSSLHEFDHSLAVNLEYRLSPHVTVSLEESFQKTSDLLNLSQQSALVSGESAPLQQGPNAIVPPSIARITNLSDAGISYQFGQNSMIGIKGSFSGLWYPNRDTVAGLYDSTTEAGEGFYTHRISRKHYIGVTYAFQQLLTHPGQAETQTHSTLFFYTLDLPRALTVSVFAGPEHSDTHGGVTIPFQKWSPAEGASVGWHGERVAFTASYSQRIRSGGGLSGVVHYNSAGASLRWQLVRTITAGLEASYSTSTLLDPSAGGFGTGGHTWAGAAILQHPLGERLGLQLGCTHLHQSYSDVAAVSGAPDQTTAWVSLSYQFARPLGR
jgi:hypothetical protein